MVDFTELKGVGPARSESLEEAGYESFEELGDTSHEDLAEEADIPEDTALELVVQSQNLAEEREASVTESKPITEQVEEAKEEDDSDDIEAVSEETEGEPEDEESGGIEFAMTLDSAYEYDSFFAALTDERNGMLRTNRKGGEVFERCLEELRDASVGDEVRFEMEEESINDIHSAIRSKITEYKGDNLIEQMDALKGVLEKVNEVRDEHLF